MAKPVTSRYLSYDASYSPDGRKIFIGPRGGEDNSTRTGLSILDAETRKSIELESSAFDLISNATFSQGGRLILAVLANGVTSPTDCQVWDATTGKRLRSFPVNARNAQKLEISPDGSRLLVTSAGYGLHLIDAQSGDELLVIPLNGLRTAKFDRDGNKIITVDGYGVRVLDGMPMPEPKK